jgi:hypothetical protein
MKKIVVLLLVFFTFITNAQKLDKSPSFEEPLGWSKLLILKNTNTVFLEFTKKEGINIKLYDANRKKILAEKLTLQLIEDKLGTYNIGGIYEIAGDVVVFFQTSVSYTPIMIRIIIDGKTGKVKAEEKISELQKLTAKDGYAYMYGDVDMPDIKVIKDPESDYYAIINYNTFAPETKDRIGIIHYSPDHKVINKANYTTPNNIYKFTKFLSGYVHKDDYVVIGAYGFNTKKSGGEDARYYLAQLAKGKTSFTQKELEYHEFYKGAKCSFFYNTIKNTINMVIITDVDLSGNVAKYDIVYQNINPTTLALDKPFKADFSKVNQIYSDKMQRKDAYNGMIQGFFYDKAGNIMALYQNTIIKYGNGTGVVGTWLGDIAIVRMEQNGKVLDASVIANDTYISGRHAIFNTSNLRNGIRLADTWQDPGLSNYQNLSLDFITTENAEYLFLNNLKENMLLADTEIPKMVKAISLATPVRYTIKKEGVKKEYLVSEPKEKKDNEFCNFACSDYNSQIKTYATLVTDPKLKTTSLIWIKLD